MPTDGLGAWRTSQQHYTRKPKNDPEDGLDKAVSVSDYWDGEDSAASSREEADKPYSHQDAQAETTTREVEVKLRKPLYNLLREEKLILRPSTCPPVHMGQSPRLTRPRRRTEGIL